MNYDFWTWQSLGGENYKKESTTNQANLILDLFTTLPP